jgi:co-chaperonin GroES (HSP10)
MKLEPTNGKVLIVPNPEEEKTKEGFSIPAGHRKPATEGKIVSALGHEGLREGDTVFFHPRSGVPVTRDGVNYLFVQVTELYGTEK